MPNNWKAVLAEIEKEVPSASFTTWFGSLVLLNIEGETAFFGVKSVFHVKPLAKYNDIIIRAFAKNDIKISDMNFEVIRENKSVVKPRTREVTGQTERKEINTSSVSISERMGDLYPRKEFESGLNPKFTMDNFVIGSNNDLAVGVAENVINNPGQKYNPFFLYGGPGLGKTHLVQAIGNALLAKNPRTKILYTPINHFYSDFINSIKNGAMEKFREKFRKLDVLIIDDFQFIVGKEKSQEEFFNIFNDLHQLNKQIIITSDRLPDQIKSVDERLASRLTWTGAFDLQFPNFEDKCAILRSKAEFMGVNIENEAIEFLAENVRTNIRDLEGEFSKVLAMSELKEMTPWSLITSGLVNIASATKVKAVSPKQIINIVAKYYDITAQELCGKSRVAHIKNARQVAMYMMSEELGMSTTKIKLEVGLKDHTTVMHGIKKIKEDMKLNFGLREQIAAIREKIYA